MSKAVGKKVPRCKLTDMRAGVNMLATTADPEVVQQGAGLEQGVSEVHGLRYVPRLGCTYEIVTKDTIARFPRDQSPQVPTPTTLTTLTVTV